MSNQVDLKTKNTAELKVIAYDLSEIIQNYTQVLNTVNQEIQFRKNNPMGMAKAVEQPKIADVKKPDSEAS